MINQNKLNLACGQVRIGDFFGIDLVKTDATDAIMDLTQFPWDIESESAEEIFCSHYVEHTILDTFSAHLKTALETTTNFATFKAEMLKYNNLVPSDGLIAFMNEVYRILKPGGKVTIIAPYYSSMRCWQDPTHRRAISDQTFFYFNKGWRDLNKLDHYQTTCDFDFVYGYNMEQDYLSKEQSVKDFATKHYINIVNDIHVTMTKRVI